MKTSKERILKIAAELFVCKGYEGVSLTDIQKEIGITRGGLFYHIESKGQLFKEVVDKYLFNAQDIENKFDYKHATTLLEFIKEYVRGVNMTMVKLRKDFPSISAGKYFLFIIEACKYIPECKIKFEELNYNEINLWKTMLSKAIENGEIKPKIDIECTAQLFRYSFIGLSYSSCLDKGLDTEQLQELFLKIYKMIKI